jgi:alkanesulfonate monooxygenase SsuD/methylene tetrahydromethanopterin reductase-like flavin-dependent oxidoreductase (luciferase family)
MRPFRFGLLLERFESPAQVLDTARKAEAAGFSTVLIRDHLIEPPLGPQYAPLTTLASIAQVTDTLRVGTLVIASDFRHPAILAKDVTTMDQLSGGRFKLGLGARLSARGISAHRIDLPPDREQTATAFAQQRGWSVPSEQVLQMPSVFIGEPGEIVEQLEHVREHLGISYFIFRDSQLDAAQAVVTRASMSGYSRLRE